FLFFRPLEADVNEDVVADHSDPAAHAKLRALEDQLGRETRALHAFQLDLLAAQERKRDRFGHAMEREVTLDLVAVLDRLDRGAREGDGGKVLDVEEVRGAQVGVALGVVGVDARRLDGHGERGFGWVSRVDGEGTGKLVEAAAYPGEAKVRDAEVDTGMV